MIALTKEKGFREVFSWKEVFEMPGYTNSLNPKEEELKQILGKYEFPTLEKCGLSNCRTPHGKGYIVETASGKLTNIGTICGQKHFSVEFESLSREFDRYYKDYKARERIENFLRNITLQLAKVENIQRSFGSIENSYKLQQFFKSKSKGCPESIVQQLHKMSKANDANIYIYKRLSNKEIELREASGERNTSLYKRISIDSLKGLPFLYDQNDLRLYATNFKRPIEEIQKLEVDKLISKDLDCWSKRIGEIEGTINQIKDIMQHGQEFLASENILKIEKTVHDYPDDFEYLLFILKAKHSINIEL